jgi:hypothetical protein
MKFRDWSVPTFGTLFLKLPNVYSSTDYNHSRNIMDEGTINKYIYVYYVSLFVINGEVYRLKRPHPQVYPTPFLGPLLITLVGFTLTLKIEADDSYEMLVPTYETCHKNLRPHTTAKAKQPLHITEKHCIYL